MGEEQFESTHTYEPSQSEENVVMSEIVKKAQEVYLKSYDIKRVNGFIVVIRKSDNKRVFRSKTITKYEKFQTNEIMEIIQRGREANRNRSTES